MVAYCIGTEKKHLEYTTTKPKSLLQRLVWYFVRTLSLRGWTIRQLHSCGAILVSQVNLFLARIHTLLYHSDFIPLPPKDVLQIWKAMKPFNFEDIIGGWPGRFIHGNAREKLLRSAKRFIAMEGHDPNVFDWQ